jgi:uncharacterized protein
MPRPFCCRRVNDEPPSKFFKPRGIPLASLEVITMTLDEYEAVRQADLGGLYQEDAADKMGVSRQTFGRIVESARRKIADALVNGKALEIKGGEIEMVNRREFQCGDCNHKWQTPCGTGRPTACPECQSRNIHRVHERPGWSAQGASGQGAGRRRLMHHRRGLQGSAPRTSPEGGTQ